MSDIFDVVRQAVEAEQTRLWRAEEDYSSRMQALRSRHKLGELNDESLAAFEQMLLETIRNCETRIVWLKEQMPPHTIEREGYLERIPMSQPIDPRTPPTAA